MGSKIGCTGFYNIFGAYYIDYPKCLAAAALADFIPIKLLVY
nr:MAG TPA: hypothetical protein [Crassvirales sp.]